MAEGGGTTIENPAFDPYDEFFDPNSYTDDVVQSSNDTTQPFNPGQVSTPHHGGEQYEMQTMNQEQSGLPDDSYAETPFLGDQDPIGERFRESFLRQKMKKAVDMIRGKFPKADFEKLKIRRGKGKVSGEIVSIGKKGGQYKVLKIEETGFTKAFLDSFKNELGPPA